MARNEACEMNFTKWPDSPKTARLRGHGETMASGYARHGTRLRGL
ncbi:hypothetical protein YSA_05171 [Pseudomonas putida ND6]|uniref:Uncharacterized protein n=1 Tax=Pseudomonas putida ND6 TaxID=231023 RepID=I3UVP4_PSEPU|nr:hypothetical protein YSA_05171 [Pseudomonas putida ND6]